MKEFLTGIINAMIEKAKKKETKSKAQPKLPLIRLRVTYQNEAYAFNEIRFGQQFNELASEVFSLSIFCVFQIILMFSQTGGKSV